MSENEKIHINQPAETENRDAPLCPKCGKKLVVKKRDADDPPTWGCSGSPVCMYSRDILSGTF